MPSNRKVVARLWLDRSVFWHNRSSALPLSRRYTPELSSRETSVFGMDFSYVIPPGVGIASGSLEIIHNTAIQDPGTEISAGPVSVQGRTLYATVTATPDAQGLDYQLIWIATDTDGNVWPRVGLVLCAETS